MCVVSNVFDYGRSTIPDRNPWIVPYVQPNTQTFIITQPTREEFDKLKREVDELKKLVEAAREYDAATGQPDCEDPAKAEFMRRLEDLIDEFHDVL